MENQQSFKKLFPDLHAKLKAKLVQAGEGGLTVAFEDLEIHYRCKCEHRFCSSFWATSRAIEDPRDEDGYRSVWIKFDENEAIFDVIINEIIYIEFETNIESVGEVLAKMDLPQKPYFVG